MLSTLSRWFFQELMARLDNLAAAVQTLNGKVDKIMSAISDFADKMKAHNDKIDAAIADLQVEVKGLNDQIAALQNSAGQITPADQALLDAIDARGQSISDKLAALDTLTPPPAPPAP